MILSLVKIGIYAIMALGILGAIGTVMLPNIFHASLSLIVVLVGTAALFISLGADFLGVVQILLYVGAVMTLVIFAVMMTHRIGDTTIPSKNKLAFPALIAVSLITGTLLAIIFKTPWPVSVHPRLMRT